MSYFLENFPLPAVEKNYPTETEFVFHHENVQMQRYKMPHKCHACRPTSTLRTFNGNANEKCIALLECLFVLEYW